MPKMYDSSHVTLNYAILEHDWTLVPQKPTETPYKT